MKNLAKIIVCLVVLAMFVAVATRDVLLGVNGYGPISSQTVTVQRLYVDYSGSGEHRASHYMVGTDKGVFEVDNGWMLDVWNADELYARLQQGHRFEITTKGNRVVSMWMQEYPYITAVREITAGPES